MKEEILTAVMFFVRFIEKSDKFPQDQLENFKKYLTELLVERFEKHWFPELPSKGQAYRCIRVNGLMPVDITLAQAATKCGITYNDLRLPAEITVWVDPNEVCYRLGESEGSYCTLATFSSDSSSDSSSPSSSPPSTPFQEKMRKNQKQITPQRYPMDIQFKQRNFNNMPLSMRTYNNVNNYNRQLFRCDGPSYQMSPTTYKNFVNYNRPHYKNVLRV